jgi:hypothetical protein
MCERNNNVSSITIVGLLGLLIFSVGCTNRNPGSEVQVGNAINQISELVGQNAYIKFRSFQNSDSTWGFTIFVNSRPYLHYRRITLPGAGEGFLSKKDAEKVAGLFVKKIQDGITKPELNYKILDSLEIKTSR